MNKESWLKTKACGLGRSKRVGYDRLGMLSLTTWDGMGHSLMMEWLPCLCCLLKGRAGYLAERGDKAERVQTLLQSALLGSNREQGRAVDGTLIQRSSTGIQFSKPISFFGSFTRPAYLFV